MADFQTLLDLVATVVGGTAFPTKSPRWFSGHDNSDDGTGLLPGGTYPKFLGCYSAPPPQIADVPVGIVMVGPFQNVGPKSQDVYTQGVEHAIDDLRLLILVSQVDPETDIANLDPYRDLVPAAFAGHMTAFSSANVLQAMCRAGKPIITKVAGIDYNGLEFTIRVIRSISRTYTA